MRTRLAARPRRRPRRTGAEAGGGWGRKPAARRLRARGCTKPASAGDPWGPGVAERAGSEYPGGSRMA